METCTSDFACIIWSSLQRVFRNVLKNRNEAATKLHVQKEIDMFDAFPTRIASPSQEKIVPEPLETKPKAQRREKTLVQLYDAKWKKLLGNARDSYENACIPEHVKAQFRKAGW